MSMWHGKPSFSVHTRMSLVKISALALGVTSPPTPQRGNPCFSPEGVYMLMVKEFFWNESYWKELLRKDWFRQGWGRLALLGLPCGSMEFSPFSFWKSFFFPLLLLKTVTYKASSLCCSVFKVIGRSSGKALSYPVRQYPDNIISL